MNNSDPRSNEHRVFAVVEIAVVLAILAVVAVLVLLVVSRSPESDATALLDWCPLPLGDGCNGTPPSVS